MRVSHGAVYLDGIDTALQGVRAYPLMSKGELHGVLVCGPKRGAKTYAPDEDEAISSLAQGVGSALGAMRPEESDLKTLLREIRDVLNLLAERKFTRTS